ncbi:MAG: hypothetical protein GX201_06685 [Clostridiales bacterium]|nr:hypothetical protein [Clostridiales bacterium]
MNIKILAKLYSKRNQVYKIRIDKEEKNQLAIMKVFSSDKEKLLDIEYRNIEMLYDYGINLPKIICKDKNRLIMEYIEGDLINDLVERLDTGVWIDKLALWFSQLHKISKNSNTLLKGDVNLRNFIYSKGEIYGLDFEEINWGDARTDLANVCFFILTNNPSFTKEKHEMIRRFLQSYEKYSGMKLQRMGLFLRNSKNEAKKRRGKHLHNLHC